MNSKELKASRVQLFRDAANFKKTERIPHFANVVTWKVFDAGYTLDQAMTNFDVLEESVVKFLERYPVDGLMEPVATPAMASTCPKRSCTTRANSILMKLRKSV